MTQDDKFTPDDKLRIRLAEIDRDIRECNNMLEHDQFKWSTRREALKREKLQCQIARAKLQAETPRDDASRRSTAVFWGSNG